ncbi:NADP-dependent phosphogluconate dehydrogenase [Pedobacter frigiditerrae]|uniref:6-phosphogluconate dehydrogenase, decarboxylating n=1 Tax=Pedobacter frigiditerrae TaxID=2530452 RepID=A0A4R0MWI5_9SPHI|nr:NADP-dependent phosphogluconate dehydrogenase [Pedobacter frigiditerrae]TCC91578.1 NADP-dependent phosphogluconate dehydrogenase [Pedobacter frigiditerrae]
MSNDNKAKFAFGMVGLGTMGRNLLLNMADNGFAVTGYDKSEKMLQIFEEEGKPHNLKGFSDIEEFVDSLQSPRTIILLVPAGAIVDSVISELLPLLAKGDIIIDSGNSYFTDTSRRSIELAEKGIHFFGMGISGGEEGARFGPSMMPGGDKQAYAVVKDMLEAVSAKANGDPCVTYIGPGASGHFVKMTHNGIEYAIMQLLAEAYEILKNGLDYDNDQIQQVFENWNNGRLKSFLMEITKDVFLFKDVKTGNLLVDEIKDEAKSKGTGKWTSQVAMDIETPIPSIDAAVSTRNLSKLKKLRVELEKAYGASEKIKASADFIDDLEEAFYFAMANAYAQGMHLLWKASIEYKYELNLAEIAKIWRGGCIIRAEFLEDIYQAYKKQPDLEHLFADAGVQEKIKKSLKGTRNVVSSAINAGIATPCFTSALTYFDTLKTGRMPSNLTQAQRDFFGAHTFERIDSEGIFHADWNQKNS